MFLEGEKTNLFSLDDERFDSLGWRERETDSFEYEKERSVVIRENWHRILSKRKCVGCGGGDKGT